MSSAQDHPPVLGKHVLAVATVAQSLALQMPDAWELLRDSGARITFAAAPDGWEDRLAQWGDFAPIRIGRRPSLRSLVQARRDTASLISARRWDLVQVQTPIAAAIVRSLAQPVEPLVYVAHGFHFHEDGRATSNILFTRIERALARRSTAIAVVSEEDFRRGRHLGLGKHALLWHLPGAGVDVDRFADVSRTMNRRDPRELLFVGDLNGNKDPLRVVRVAAGLREAMGTKRVHLTMVGVGPLQAAVAEAIARYGLDADLVSRSDDVPGFMAAADVLLAPSHREGLPRVIIEALASGLPVVAQSNRGSRELLAGGIGTLVPAGAEDQDWIAAVTQAGIDFSSERAFARASEYSSAAFLRSYSALLTRVLG